MNAAGNKEADFYEKNIKNDKKIFSFCYDIIDGGYNAADDGVLQ